MRQFRRFLLAAAALVAAALLSGCAGTYLLDNRVQSFSTLPALPAAPTYRFERLPSQQADPAQGQLESLADPALFKAGLRRDDAAPRYSVQVSARTQRVLSPYADPWDSWGWGWGIGRRRWQLGGFSSWDRPWYEREVAVIVREVGSNRVVYESRAGNDGPVSDSGAVLTAMFEAALQGFPNPPQGVRRVDIPLAY
jgi:hypothetical protein